MNAPSILADLHAAGVSLWLDGERLRYRAPAGAMTDTVRAAIVEHRAEFLDQLRPAVTADDLPGVEFEPPEPCPRCDGLAFWWSLAGEHHCTQCDPPTKAIEWLDRAQSIRDKLRLPTNALADRMLADLRQLTSRD